MINEFLNSIRMTRYVYAKEPLIFHANGLLMDHRELPKAYRTIVGETKDFINDLLKRLLVDINPVGYHQCNTFCKQPVQILLGYPHGCDVRSAVPVEMNKTVGEFERLIEEKIYSMEERVELQTVSLRLLPCSRYLEILDCAIYL